MMNKEPLYLHNAITNDDLKRIEKVFTSMKNDPQAYDFLAPVDYEALNLLDYPTIIKHPMDLGTVEQKVKEGKYPTFQEFFSDIDLIWTNCRTYNMAGSDIVKMANHCEKAFKRHMDKQFKNYSEKKSNSMPSAKEQVKEELIGGSLVIDEKIALADKFRNLSNKGLTHIVQLIQKECPNAIEDIDSEKLQIKVDLIDRKTYNNLLETISKLKKIDK